MEATPENIIAVLQKQIVQTRQCRHEVSYNPALTRESVAALAHRYGGPALDVGTGACACLAVVAAFDTLCHTKESDLVIQEMFRVSSHAVIITELNADGRELTRHYDGGFHEQLLVLLARHCVNCRRFDDAHHVTYACELN